MLYMVSLGPGDPSLVTLKALDTLKAVDAICIPTKSGDRSFTKSLSYRIVEELASRYSLKARRVPIYAPMNYREEDWREQAKEIADCLDRYGETAFVTLGDAAIYSSVYYLLDIFERDYPELYEKCEVIAGVTSFSQASAKVKKPLCLGESALSIEPLPLRETQRSRVYMRPWVGMPTESIPESGELYRFENLDGEREKILLGRGDEIDSYMTLFIDFCRKREE